MKRRGFLDALLGFGVALTATSVQARPQQRKLLLQTSPIAGFQYHDGDVVWTSLRVGDALTLAREPNNPHDENAVRVLWEDSSLGYVPRSDNYALAQLLDRDQSVTAHIARLTESSNPWERVEFAVELWV